MGINERDAKIPRREFLKTILKAAAGTSAVTTLGTGGIELIHGLLCQASENTLLQDIQPTIELMAKDRLDWKADLQQCIHLAKK